jgi:hypothetical protein
LAAVDNMMDPAGLVAQAPGGRLELEGRGNAVRSSSCSAITASARWTVASGRGRCLSWAAGLDAVARDCGERLGAIIGRPCATKTTGRPDGPGAGATFVTRWGRFSVPGRGGSSSGRWRRTGGTCTPRSTRQGNRGAIPDPAAGAAIHARADEDRRAVHAREGSFAGWFRLIAALVPTPRVLVWDGGARSAGAGPGGQSCLGFRVSPVAGHFLAPGSPGAEVGI